MKNSKSGFTIVEVLIVVFVLGLLIVTPWFVNAGKFFSSDFDPIGKREIVHGVGLIPPFSIVTCWFNIED